MQYTDDVVTRWGAAFYSSIALVIILFGSFASAMIVFGIEERSWGILLFAAGLLLVLWYYVTRYYRVAPIVRVTQAGITWKNTFYGWDDVSSIILTGSQPMKMVGGKNVEGTAIVLRNGSKIILLEGMYSNLAAVRQLIARVAPQLVHQPFKTETATDRLNVLHRNTAAISAPAVEVTADGAQYVRGSAILNMYGIFTWVFFLGALLGSVSLGDAGATVFLMLLAFGFGALFTMFLNYFGVSNEALIERNVYRPWKKKRYRLSEIHEVILASNHNGSNTLRLVFTDYRFKEFTAAGLSGSDWLVLMQLLQSRGIEVKDENNFEMWAKPQMKKVQRYMVLYFVLWFIAFTILYLFFTPLNVSENMLIVIKLGSIVFAIVTLILMLKLLSRKYADAEKG